MKKVLEFKKKRMYIYIYIFLFFRTHLNSEYIKTKVLEWNQHRNKEKEHEKNNETRDHEKEIRKVKER